MKVMFQYLRYLRVGLRSKELFRNWFGAGLMYLLYRLGLINNRVVKVILKDVVWLLQSLIGLIGLSMLTTMV